MDLHQLRCFVSVARHNGFRRGAEDLHIAQPAVSRHIRRLEAEIGQELFHRLSRGVALTEAGEVLLQHSEELFDRISDIHEELASLTDRVSGTVRIGGASSIAEILFPPLADRVHKQLPNVQLSFSESGCRLLSWLEQGHIDVAVLSCPWQMAQPGWESVPLVGERVYLVSPAAMPADAGMPTVAMSRVLALPLILSPSPNAQRLRLAEEAKRVGMTINVVAEAESLNGQAALVQRGLGFAVLPYSAARLAEKDYPLSTCEIRGFSTCRTMLRRAGRRRSRAEREVGRIIAREMSRLAGEGAFGTPPADRKSMGRA